MGSLDQLLGSVPNSISIVYLRSRFRESRWSCSFPRHLCAPRGEHGCPAPKRSNLVEPYKRVGSNKGYCFTMRLMFAWIRPRLPLVLLSFQGQPLPPTHKQHITHTDTDTQTTHTDTQTTHTQTQTHKQHTQTHKQHTHRHRHANNTHTHTAEGPQSFSSKALAKVSASWFELDILLLQVRRLGTHTAGR